MKKITLLFIAFFALSLSINSQTISFEASEGYVLGDINEQNNWEVTQDSDGDFIQNQVITDEASSDGTYSLKIAQETDYPGFTDALIGAFYNYDSPLSTDQSTFSADIYISSEQGMSGLSFLFGLLSPDMRYRTYVNFSYEGSMDALVQSADPGRIEKVDLGRTWEPNTWYNIKMELNGPEVKYYFDGELIHEAELASTGSIAQVNFTHDNYEGFVYIDNFKTNEDELSIADFDSKNITHFLNQDSKMLTLKSHDEAFSNVSIFNALGQSIMDKKLSHKTENIDMSSFSNGLYIVRMTIGNSIKTVKVLKR